MRRENDGTRQPIRRMVLAVSGRDTSLQEDGERRVLEGELETLERAWREAEQIAAIADALLLPGDVLERIAGLRKNLRCPGFAFS